MEFWRMMESNSSNMRRIFSMNTSDYGGVNPLKALENIKKRGWERKEGKKSDLKTALILQGGGMRGVFGAGVCCALEELGYTEGFDEIYGASAGALNGAYFLSGQAAYGATIYYQDINNQNFINFLRFKKMVDIDFLMSIITGRKPLNIKKLINSPTPLNIVLTHISTGKSAIFRSKDNANSLLDILKATAALPFAYDIPVSIQGVDYLDGGISCPIPITEAIEGGCTDILVVLTRPKGYEPSEPKGIFDHYFIEPRIRKHGENFYRAYINRHHIHKERLRIIKGEKIYKGKRVNILAVFPGESLKIGRMTRKESILKNAATEGAVKTLKLFGVDHYHPVEVLKFLN
jgi:predicted patatin/cPLA2 family phospholipase